MELQRAAGEVIVNVVPAHVNMVGVRAEVNRVIKLGRSRIDAGIVDIIAIELRLVAFAHFKAAHLVVSAGTLHFIADNSPAGSSNIHGLRAAYDMQL